MTRSCYERRVALVPDTEGWADHVPRGDWSEHSDMEPVWGGAESGQLLWPAAVRSMEAVTACGSCYHAVMVLWCTRSPGLASQLLGHCSHWSMVQREASAASRT